MNGEPLPIHHGFPLRLAEWTGVPLKEVLIQRLLNIVHEASHSSSVIMRSRWESPIGRPE
jgi:DMSO/TMAO reductase YedYZ molybdopterin-dependent catalytic subunit